jgi:hypothetical protein
MAARLDLYPQNQKRNGEKERGRRDEGEGMRDERKIRTGCISDSLFDFFV